jgi:alkylhydroperoxidase/carboxymuconolactone decarboxylase family protein YurZ
MVEEGYGRVLSRPRLSAQKRELVAVTVLAAGGWERQLTSHLLGARRLRAPAADIRAAVRLGLAGATAVTRHRAAAAWRAAFGSSLRV